MELEVAASRSFCSTQGSCLTFLRRRCLLLGHWLEQRFAEGATLSPPSSKSGRVMPREWQSHRSEGNEGADCLWAQLNRVDLGIRTEYSLACL